MAAVMERGAKFQKCDDPATTGLIPPILELDLTGTRAPASTRSRVFWAALFTWNPLPHPRHSSTSHLSHLVGHHHLVIRQLFTRPPRVYCCMVSVLMSVIWLQSTQSTRRCFCRSYCVLSCMTASIMATAARSRSLLVFIIGGQAN